MWEINVRVVNQTRLFIDKTSWNNAQTPAIENVSK